jgi:hypothetical protein
MDKIRNKIWEYFHYNENDLYFRRDLTKSSGYGYVTLERNIKQTKITHLYKQMSYFDFYIISKMNNGIYPMFDIDDYNTYQNFLSNNENKYVTIQSSKNHFWVILDTPFNKYNEFVESKIYNEWNVYSDNKFNSMCNRKEDFYIRGTFEKLERQPNIIHKSDNLSVDFNIFINKLTQYFSETSLELSILRYKEEDMLLKYNRILKLKRILL